MDITPYFIYFWRPFNYQKSIYKVVTKFIYENIIKNFDLTYKQKKQAKKELIKKLKIIINGAFKRNNLSIVNEFSTKLEYWDKVNFQEHYL